MKTFEQCVKDYYHNLETFEQGVSTKQVKKNLSCFQEIFDSINDLFSSDEIKAEIFEKIYTKEGLLLSKNNILDLQKRYCMIVGWLEFGKDANRKLEINSFIIKNNCYDLFGIANVWINKEKEQKQIAAPGNNIKQNTIKIDNGKAFF